MALDPRRAALRKLLATLSVPLVEFLRRAAMSRWRVELDRLRFDEGELILLVGELGYYLREHGSTGGPFLLSKEEMEAEEDPPPPSEKVAGLYATGKGW